MLPVSGETILTRFIHFLTHRGEYASLEEVADVVKNSPSDATKVAGIDFLREVGSDGALDTLVKISEEDNGALSSQEVYGAMQQAIVSYEDRAEPPMVRLFEEHRKP